jgi:hypothetical protein
LAILAKARKSQADSSQYSQHEETNMFLAGLVVGLIIGILIGMVASVGAYHNGMIIGFGYSVDPCNPEWEEAGEWLQENEAYRWSHELKKLAVQQAYCKSRQKG